MSMITSKIDLTIKKYAMLADGDTVAVGVSGGADSMLLLHYLLSVRASLHLKLIVMNVEHGIRGEASEKDTAFVRQFCLEHDVPFKGIAVDVPTEAAAAGQGVEEYARACRYRFFESVGADKIATAHNATDNLETVLFRLIRGTGIKGCCGIPPVRGNIIRPLIDCTAEEIRAYCDDRHIPYVIDETNYDNRYTRNFLRHQVLPAMRELNPSLEAAGARLIRSAAEAQAYLDEQAAACLQRSLRNNRLYHLQAEPPLVAKTAIVQWLDGYGVSLDEQHLEGVCTLVNSPGKYQLKERLFVVSDAQCLRLAIFDDPVDFDRVQLESVYVSADTFRKAAAAYQQQYDFACDGDKTVGQVTVRARREGDTVRPVGRGVTKSLKKLYNEAKIPVEERASLPVLADEAGVIGVGSLCADERVKIDGDTKRVLLLKILMEDKH